MIREGDKRALAEIVIPSSTLECPWNHTTRRACWPGIAGAVEVQFGDDIAFKQVGE
jgi:hypothetical protein